MKNLGNTERVIRIILGILIIAWGIKAQSWLGVIGLIILITGIIGWCGVYQLFKKSCCSADKNKEEKKENKPQGGSCCSGAK